MANIFDAIFTNEGCNIDGTSMRNPITNAVDNIFNNMDSFQDYHQHDQIDIESIEMYNNQQVEQSTQVHIDQDIMLSSHETSYMNDLQAMNNLENYWNPSQDFSNFQNYGNNMHIDPFMMQVTSVLRYNTF